MKAIKVKDIRPNRVKNKLEDIEPQKPKKFVISLFPLIFPIPGSFGLWVNMLINKKADKQIKKNPNKIFNKNNLKPLYLNIINNIICNTFRIR